MLFLKTSFVCHRCVFDGEKQKTNNHDLLSLRLYSDANEAWEVDTYDEDEDELDALVHHMEHELFGQ